MTQRVQTQLTEERRRSSELMRNAREAVTELVNRLDEIEAEHAALADAYLAQPKEHPTVAEFRIDGSRCAMCGGGAYPPWLTDDETWRKVMGDSHEQVCLPCFNDRVRTGGPLRVSVGSPETPVMFRGPTTYTEACDCGSELKGWHRHDCGVFGVGSPETTKEEM